MKVNYLNFISQWQEEKKFLIPIIKKVMSSGQYVGVKAEEITKFENKVKKMCGVKHAVALNSGTDALILAMHSMGIKKGDEVITPANSYVASTGAIIHLGAIPVFADVLPDQNIDPKKIEAAITNKTKAIMPVHLTGRPAKMDEILEIANHYKIPVLEDAAQAAGAKYKGKKVGGLGNAAGYSLHPLKNLHAFGDGGMVTTSDPQIYQMMLQARNHGLINREQCGFWSYNSRLDELQATMLLVQLPHLDTWTKERRRLALRYNDLLRPCANVPDEGEGEYCVFQTYVIQVDNRDKLQTYLNSNGVQALVHYPLPLHMQPAAKALGYTEKDFPRTMELSSRILSLPLYPELKEEQQDYVADLILKFFK